MTTIHTNTCRDALSRLEQMIGMTGFDLPTKSMRAQIASALHVVIQIERMSDGRRRLVSLQEIRSEEHTSELQSLMRQSYAVCCLNKKHVPKHQIISQLSLAQLSYK